MNLLSLLREQQVEYKQVGEHHHATAGFIQLDCPYCSPHSKHFRLGWNLKSKYFNCWQCGHLPSLSTWSEILALPQHQIRHLFDNLETPTPIDTRPSGRLHLPSGLGPLRKPHRNYLKNRGFTDIESLVERWKIRGIDHTNPYLAWRIFIPIIANEQIVSWTTRAISDRVRARYITARREEEKRSFKDVIYGADFCLHTIIVVEGPLDVWKIGPGAGAILGLAYSRSQLLQIASFPVRYICLDREPQAQRVARKLANELSAFPGTTKLITLESKDPASAASHEIRSLQRLLL